jgi:hypothetical protein
MMLKPTEANSKRAATKLAALNSFTLENVLD